MEKEIIFETKQPLLVSEGTLWTKKSNTDFDVPMGSFDSAEVCDLVGLFLLSELEKLKVDVQFGLYKDDGLAVTRLSPQRAENVKKKICSLFQKHGLRITIEANKQVVQYLDVELNLEDGSFKPFVKPNDILIFLFLHFYFHHHVSKYLLYRKIYFPNI